MENKEQEIDLLELSKKVWFERKKVIKWGIIGAIIGLIIAFSIPKTYQTMVKFAAEDGKKGSNLDSGLAAMAGISTGSESAGISSNIYPEIISSTPFLLDFADIKVINNDKEISFYDYITEEQSKPWWEYIIFTIPTKTIGWIVGLFSEKTDDNNSDINVFRPTQKQLAYTNTLNKLISMEMGKEKTSTTITTTMQDPLIAAIISDSILTNLQRYMVRYKTSKTRADLDMNTKKLKEAQAKYYRADSLYAISVDRNQSLITQEARIKLERLANEKLLAFSIYQQIASEVESSRIKLQEDTPIATVIEPAKVAIRASSPKKPVILIAFAFMGAFFVISSIVVKELMKKNEE